MATSKLQFETVGLLFMGCPQLPETIDALKENIRESIGEIQLHTIDINIILARRPEIGQGLGRILSCGARKPEQIYMDL